ISKFLGEIQLVAPADSMEQGRRSHVPTTELMIQTFSSMRAAPNAQAFQDHFWQLMERFRADLVHQALAMLGNQADAEDVAQETLCRAYLEIHKLQDPAKLGVWLRSINRC